MITAKEAYNMSLKNVAVSVINEIMNYIKYAISIGKFGTTIKLELSSIQCKIIEKELLKLGYTVSIKTKQIPGSLKQITIIKLTWYKSDD